MAAAISSGRPMRRVGSFATIAEDFASFRSVEKPMLFRVVGSGAAQPSLSTDRRERGAHRKSRLTDLCGRVVRPLYYDSGLRHAHSLQRIGSVPTKPIVVRLVAILIR